MSRDLFGGLDNSHWLKFFYTQIEFDQHNLGVATLLVYCGVRTLEEQARLFRKGRSLRQIRHRATLLDEQWGRPDLAEILLGVGPQSGRDIVTWAGPGQSAHNYGLAVDSAPLQSGKPVWGTKEPWELSLWKQYGIIAVGNGLEWAGNWPKRKREFPHIQVKGFNWKDLIRGYDFGRVRET